MTPFDHAFQILLGHEGGFDVTPADPGNWTSGKVGEGQCLGTKWGVDTASYADILRGLGEVLAGTMPATVKDLTVDHARTIYHARYWALIDGDLLPPLLALIVFDAAVNNGVGRADRWLQVAVGTNPDGVIGPATLAALKARLAAVGGAAVAAELQAQRIFFMGCLGTWRTFGLGWARRLALLPYQSLTMTEN